MDAEAYPEAATNVLKILWDIGTYREVIQSSLWIRAQNAAFKGLLQYEVGGLMPFYTFLYCFCRHFVLCNLMLPIKSSVVNQVMMRP